MLMLSYRYQLFGLTCIKIGNRGNSLLVAQSLKSPPTRIPKAHKLTCCNTRYKKRDLSLEPQTHAADNFYTHCRTHTLKSPWHWSTFIQAKAGAQSVTCKHSHIHKPNAPALTCMHSIVIILGCACTVRWWHRSGPDVASQTGLEVQTRRSGGPLGQEKPFPPWSGVGRREQQWELRRMVLVVVRGRMFSAERNSQNVVL